MLHFSKPAGSGVELEKDAYLAVLASRGPLPTLLEAVSPKGDGGSVPGFGVPVSSGAPPPDRPLERGVYGIASPNRKSVLRLRVLSKEEAGFRPDDAALDQIDRRFGPEVAGRVRAAWTLLQLTWESYDPEVYPALDFWLDVAHRLAFLTDGVVADPIAQSYRLPGTRPPRPPGQPVLAAEHVSVIVRGGGHLHTAGLRKFGRPEIEATGVPEAATGAVSAALASLAQACLQGARPSPGERMGVGDGLLRVADGGLDRAYWAGAYVLEILPEQPSDWASFRL